MRSKTISALFTAILSTGLAQTEILQIDDLDASKTIQSNDSNEYNARFNETASLLEN